MDKIIFEEKNDIGWFIDTSTDPLLVGKLMRQMSQHINIIF